MLIKESKSLFSDSFSRMSFKESWNPLKWVGWFFELGECICKWIYGFFVFVEGVYIAWTFIRIDLEVINDGVYALACALTFLFVMTDEEGFICMLFWLGFNSRFDCIIMT